MHQAIIDYLEQHQARYVIHQHVAVRTVADSLEKLPFPLAQYLTTIAFRSKRAGWVLAARRGTDKIDYKKLAAALGVKRDEVVRPAPDEVLAALGTEVGTVCPIPTVADVRLLVDRRLPVGIPLYAGAGMAGRTLEITLDELLRITNAPVIDIVTDS